MFEEVDGLPDGHACAVVFGFGGGGAEMGEADAVLGLEEGFVAEVGDVA